MKYKVVISGTIDLKKLHDAKHVEYNNNNKKIKKGKKERYLIK